MHLWAMRTTVTLDAARLAQAQPLCGESKRSALVERESSRRLAALGGSQPDLKPIARRRSGS